MLIWRLGLQASFLAKDGSGEFFVGAKEPEFWLLGITFSLLLFVCARNLPGLGYQGPYELSDIASLWGVSLGVGLILYMLIFGVARWRDICRTKRLAADAEKLSEAKALADRDKAARTLTSNDDVITALERMKLRGYDVRDGKRVKSTETANPFKGFRLWSENNGETFWVMPPIQCRKLKDELDKLDPAGKTDDTARLYEALKEARDEGLAEVCWLRNGSLDGPTERKPSEFSDAEDEMFDLVVLTDDAQGG